MNSFEISENTFQIIVMFTGMIAMGTMGFKYSSRRAIVLACTYTSFMLGTLFYTLHMTIIGDIPRIFYVSDISWMASYLFTLLLMSMRRWRREKQIRFKAVPAVLSVIAFVSAIYNELLGPSKFMSCGIGLITGAIVYFAVDAMITSKASGNKIRGFDITVTAVVFLQNLLYFVSEYTQDYTHFNLYFAVDILLTLHFAMLAYFLGKEVKQNGAY